MDNDKHYGQLSAESSQAERAYWMMAAWLAGFNQSRLISWTMGTFISTRCYLMSIEDEDIMFV